MCSVVCACCALVCGTDTRNNSAVGTFAARCKVGLCIGLCAGLCTGVCMGTHLPSSMKSDIECPRKPPNGLGKTKECRRKTGFLNATNIVLLSHTGFTTKCSTRCCSKTPKDGCAFSNSQNTHKYICKFAKRRTRRLKMFVLLEKKQIPRDFQPIRKTRT